MFRGASGNQDSQEEESLFTGQVYVNHSNLRQRTWKKEKCFPNQENAHHEVHSQDIFDPYRKSFSAPGVVV